LETVKLPKQGRIANKPGPYRMTKRAELIDRTRMRITEAAIAQHLSVGPSRTSISSIAEEAGVTRPTVYRHFADMDEVFGACMGHWLATHPTPDPGPWVAIQAFEARARRVLTDLYRWYGDVGFVLYPILRDIDSVPPRSRAAIEGWSDQFAEVILSAGPSVGPPAKRLRAAAVHIVRLPTWRALVLGGGLATDDAVDLGVLWLVAAASGLSTAVD
jgi:AcrR family transcriptional regulator